METRTVLFVEDDPTWRDSLVDLVECDRLKELGLNVLTAECGTSALHCVENERVDLAFVDVRLPWVEGYELTRHIMQRSPQTRVVLWSFDLDYDLAEEVLLDGAFDCMERGPLLGGTELRDLLVRLITASGEEAGKSFFAQQIQKAFRSFLWDLERALGSCAVLRLSVVNGSIHLTETAIPYNLRDLFSGRSASLEGINPYLLEWINRGSVRAMSVTKLWLPAIARREQWKRPELGTVVVIPYILRGFSRPAETGCFLVFCRKGLRLSRRRRQLLSVAVDGFKQRYKYICLVKAYAQAIYCARTSHELAASRTDLPYVPGDTDAEARASERAPDRAVRLHDLRAFISSLGVLCSHLEREGPSFFPEDYGAMSEIRKIRMATSELMRRIDEKRDVWRPELIATESPQRGGQDSDLPRARILVVDDRVIDREACRLILERQHYVVENASDAETALLLADSAEPDAFLIDMRMPRGEEGIELVRTLRSRGVSSPIIVMTAYGTVPATVRALHAGADDFILKDESFEQVLCQVLGTALRTSTLSQAHRRLIEHLWIEVREQSDPHKKGKALEDLFARLLESVNGFRIVGANVRTETEEIDLLVAIHRGDPYWLNQGSHFLVECKNWSSIIGKNEVVVFREKMQNRYGRCRLGFLVALGGIASTVSRELLRGSKGEALVVPVLKDDIARLIEAEEREKVLRDLVDAAVAL